MLLLNNISQTSLQNASDSVCLTIKACAQQSNTTDIQIETFLKSDIESMESFSAQTLILLPLTILQTHFPASCFSFVQPRATAFPTSALQYWAGKPGYAECMCAGIKYEPHNAHCRSMLPSAFYLQNCSELKCILGTKLSDGTGGRPNI